MTAEAEAAENDDFFEELAWAYESGAGLARSASRILASLIVAEEPHLTAPELAERTGVSAGSISTMLRTLEQLGFVERFRRRGSRRELIRLTEHTWSRALERAVETNRRYEHLAEKGLTRFPAESPAYERLSGMRDYHAFVAMRLPALVEEFHKSGGRPEEP